MALGSDPPATPRGVQRDVDAGRRDPTVAVLEGVHALKHALRFGARVRRVASVDPAALQALLARLAPDVVVPGPVEAVGPAQWESLTHGGLPSPALAIAVRPPDTLDAVLATPSPAPVVVLEQPTHLGNLGAAVRVAAAADAAGVLVVGDIDPWHPRAVRGAAGLVFALPVERRTHLPTSPRPLVAVDPDGDDVTRTGVPQGALLVFGTERAGLSAEVLGRADHRVRLPMRAGVSSLNLATAVAALLYRDR